MRLPRRHGLDERAVDGEVLVAHELFVARLLDDGTEKLPGYVMLEHRSRLREKVL
jgi:hypothetical protein